MLLLFICISRHFPERLKTRAERKCSRSMAKRVTDGYYHSLSGRHDVAGAGCVRLGDGRCGRNLAIAEVLKNKSVRALTLPEGLFP